MCEVNENPRLSQHWRAIGATDNLAELSKLDEQIILDELNARYAKDVIYTYVGDILVAVNPFKELPIYDKEVALRYTKAQLLKDPPHIYVTVSHVYKCMLGEEYDVGPHDQCIVISGESGAGKTESTKLVVKQIIELCNGNTQLEQQILQVNPLLEAFGNAKTIINSNSSRFGKYIQLLFSSGKVIGAKISEYLLEKSRVVHQNDGDTNFHIFSYMFAGCSAEQKRMYRLKKPADYRYTQSLDKTATEINRPQVNFEELQNAMDLVGFSEEEQDDLLSILSGVLAIGNINFAAKADGEKVGVTYPEDLEVTAELFGVHEDDLLDCLTYLQNETRGEQILINYNKQQAEDARDAVAKVIYGRLFSWIVNKVNQRLAPQQHTSEEHEIGILDIFGFENFASNSFEQACINLANEHLQFFFNEHIFALEQEEYKSEGIKWNHISYTDNQPLLDLFLKRPIGILALLDEESHFPQATDTTFVSKINMNLSSHTYYKSHRSVGTPCFTIRHYAGEVTYEVKNWLEKNRDTVPPTLTTILKLSNNHLLRTIFKGTITRTGTLALQNRTRKSLANKQTGTKTTAPTNIKKLTVGTQFKNSLQELIKHMSQAEPHFIRCLKPNNQQLPDKFDANYVLSQLSYTGMLQTVQIRRDGYAFRPLIADFISTYKLLLFHRDVPVDGDTCKQILSAAHITDWHIGKTKVFLKYSHGETLAKHLSRLVRVATLLQSVVRGFLARRYVQKMRAVSYQQKLYVESFLRSLHLNNESFIHEQEDLLKHERQQKEEEKRKQEAALKAAEQERERTRLRESLVEQEQLSSYRSSVAAHEPTHGTDFTARQKPERPSKPKRLSAAYAQMEPVVGRERRLSRSQLDPLPSVPEPPVLPAQPSSVAAAIYMQPARVNTLRRKLFSDQRIRSVVDKLSKFGYGGDEDDDVIEDDFSVAHQAEVQASPYGMAGTRSATVDWFKKSQVHKLMKPDSSELYEWFHGIIPRGKAEHMLTLKNIGTFMLRMSERRFGYVLSFRAEGRCRHYMVAPTPSNKYVIVGESKVHKTLSTLVEYHQQHAISNWNGVLTEPCGQSDHSKPDYLELLPSIVGATYLCDQPVASHNTSNHNRVSQPSNGSSRRSPASAPPLPPKVNSRKEPTNYVSYK